MAENIWRNASTLLAIAQFALYIAGFSRYKSKLEDIADSQEEFSDAKSGRYKELRNNNPEFYDYYNELPEYEQCESNILRSRGAPGARYGEAIRGTYQANNGYTPLRNVAVANLLGKDMSSAPSLKRAQTVIAERAIQDDHTLQRWQAVISSPIQSSGATDVSNIIQSSFKSLGAFGRGANAAGVSIGQNYFNNGGSLLSRG